MKISIFYSTLSCIKKCIGFLKGAMNKKIFFGLTMFTFLGACYAPSAMIGPVYTFTSTGNLAQAGFSYGSSELITSYTGKTPIENLEEIANKNLSVEKNIKKQTLESDDFYQLVLTKIKKTKDKIVLTNQ